MLQLMLPQRHGAVDGDECIEELKSVRLRYVEFTFRAVIFVREG